MLKSFTQQTVEARNEGRDIKEILLALLEKHRGEENMTTMVAAELRVSHQTIRNWCHKFDLDLNLYR